MKFEKYLTFPDYDPEEEELKLELWLYKIWNGEGPAKLLLESENGRL